MPADEPTARAAGRAARRPESRPPAGGPRPARTLPAALLVLLLLTQVGPVGARAARPLMALTLGGDAGEWYRDVSGHWARNYIRVLWEEDVTRPLYSRPAGRWRRFSYFCPDRDIRPADFGGMLGRVFPGGPFPPPPIALDLTRSGGGGRDGSSSVLKRHDAVVALVEALGLGDFARAMTPDSAWTYLSQFRDGSSVPPDCRNAMALAVRLGIIEGYPDRTLRPGRPLTRAEGVVVLYRSCLCLVKATPNPFSPDGDGADDVTVFVLGSLRNRNARDWDLRVLDSRGHTLRRLAPRGAAGPPPAEVAWDGTDDDGRVLTPGVYYYQASLTDRKDLVHHSALKPIVIEARSLTGYVHPPVVLPGGEVRLSALAAGSPSAVTAVLSSFPEAGPLALDAEDGRRSWRGGFRVSPTAGPGPCVVTFTAWYPGATRTATAVFEVGRFALTGSLDPNPVPAGAEVTVTARPNLRADSCRAVFRLPGGGLDLTLSTDPAPGRDGPRTWSGSIRLPPNTEPGRYEVVLTALRAGLSAETRLRLEVTEGAAGLTFILTG